jgi:hypothetical protein
MKKFKALLHKTGRLGCLLRLAMPLNGSTQEIRFCTSTSLTPKPLSKFKCGVCVAAPWLNLKVLKNLFQNLRVFPTLGQTARRLAYLCFLAHGNGGWALSESLLPADKIKPCSICHMFTEEILFDRTAERSESDMCVKNPRYSAFEKGHFRGLYHGWAVCFPHWMG